MSIESKPLRWTEHGDPVLTIAVALDRLGRRWSRRMAWNRTVRPEGEAVTARDLVFVGLLVLQACGLCGLAAIAGRRPR